MEQSMKPYDKLKIVVVNLKDDDAVRTSQTREDIFSKGSNIWEGVDDTPSGS